MIFFNEKLFQKDSDAFQYRKLTLKVRIQHILPIFTQVTPRLKNFLVDWLLPLGLKEGQVKCATVCITSWVVLIPLSKKQELYRRRDEILLDGYNTFRCQIDEPTRLAFFPTLLALFPPYLFIRYFFFQTSTLQAYLALLFYEIYSK